MIDTANHYLSPSAIKKTIDGMLMVKLNVLHWHIVGSYSFPMDVGNPSGIYLRNLMSLPILFH